MEALLITKATSDDIIYEKYYRNKYTYPISEILSNDSKERYRTFQNYIVCYYIENDVKLVGILSHFFFLNSVIDMLAQVCECISVYFMQDISVQLLRNNIVVVMLLLEEMVDFGLPSILNSDALKLVIPPNTMFTKTMNFFKGHLVGDLLTKISSSIPATKLPQYGKEIGAGSGEGVGSGILATGSNNWWRRGNAKYIFNELYLNVIEHLHCIVNKQKVVSSYVTGNMDIRSQISGVPRVKVFLKNASVLGKIPMISFHSAVEQSVWQNDGVIKFIPTDTYFNICSYSLIPNKCLPPPFSVSGNFIPIHSSNSPLNNMPVNSAGISVMQPASSVENTINFTITVKTNTDFRSASFTSVENTSNLKVSDICFKLNLPLSTQSVSFTSVSHGLAKFVSSQQVFSWFLPDVQLSSPFTSTCSGSIKTSNLDKYPHSINWTASMSFVIRNWPISSLQIDFVETSGKNSFETKNVSYITKNGSITYYL